jgi:hypothetical protein
MWCISDDDYDDDDVNHTVKVRCGAAPVPAIINPPT